MLGRYTVGFSSFTAKLTTCMPQNKEIKRLYDDTQTS